MVEKWWLNIFQLWQSSGRGLGGAMVAEQWWAMVVGGLNILNSG